MKEALAKLVKAARTAKRADDALRNVGYTDTPYFDIYGDIVDGIYAMLGEKTNTLEESVTYTALSNPDMADDECADALVAKYCQNIPRLSEHVNESLKDAADQIGISIQAMINVILCEWALQRDVLKEHLLVKMTL